MIGREYRLVETGETTRDAIAADDAYCREATVHYRDHGPHDETPGPWRKYGTSEYVDAGSPTQGTRPLP